MGVVSQVLQVAWTDRAVQSDCPSAVLLHPFRGNSQTRRRIAEVPGDLSEGDLRIAELDPHELGVLGQRWQTFPADRYVANADRTQRGQRSQLRDPGVGRRAISQFQEPQMVESAQARQSGVGHTVAADGQRLEGPSLENPAKAIVAHVLAGERFDTQFGHAGQCLEPRVAHRDGMDQADEIRMLAEVLQRSFSQSGVVDVEHLQIGQPREVHDPGVGDLGLP